MIRPAEAQDAVALAEVRVRCWLETYGQIVPPEALEADPPDERVSRWRESSGG